VRVCKSWPHGVFSNESAAELSFELLACSEKKFIKRIDR
jgi:hypothetical protein